MFNFTAAEKQALFFILGIIILGSICSFAVKKNIVVRKFVYSPVLYSKCNLNKASKSALIALPYVGEKMAQKIIDYRMQNGNFTCLDDLKNIKGFSVKKINKFKDLVIFE